MLEANTDRSYFMIGAVIIAAVLIAGATWLFRDVIFGENGSIDVMVEKLFTQGNTAVDNIDLDTTTTPTP